MFIRYLDRILIVWHSIRHENVEKTKEIIELLCICHTFKMLKLHSTAMWKTKLATRAELHVANMFSQLTQFNSITISSKIIAYTITNQWENYNRLSIWKKTWAQRAQALDGGQMLKSKYSIHKPIPKILFLFLFFLSFSFYTNKYLQWHNKIESRYEA